MAAHYVTCFNISWINTELLLLLFLLHVRKRETVGYVMKLSKHFLWRVRGWDRSVCLLSCCWNHLPVLQTSHLLTLPQHCCSMEYGLHHRRNDEKKYIKNFCRGKDFRKGRARAEKKIPQDFKVLNCKGDKSFSKIALQ